MFDPHMNEAFVHVDPVNSTKELTQLFYSMTEEIWPDLTFGDETYLNVYMRRSQNYMGKRDIYNGLRGFDMPNEDNWEDYCKTYEYKSGTLYYTMLRKENAKLRDGEYLNIWCFVHNDFDELSKKYVKEIDAVIPNLRKNFWFSYMEHDCQFRWHTDGDTGFRYHHVLLNDGEGITSSIETEDGAVWRKPGEAFVLNTSKAHSVVPSRSVRLHAVASMNGPHSTKQGHNNQWLEDKGVDWQEWEDKYYNNNR